MILEAPGTRPSGPRPVLVGIDGGKAPHAAVLQVSDHRGSSGDRAMPGALSETWQASRPSILRRPSPKINDERDINGKDTIVRKALTMSLPRTRLLKKAEAAERTMSFYFEKPAGFTYKAGQFADYTLLDPPETDAEGNIRGFSLASAPFEPSLMATTRLRDTAFKRVLRELPPGSELELDAPYGSFALHNKEARPAVFLTGGIGITPVRSIVLQSVHDKTKHTIFVFCSNRRPEDGAFLDEFGRVGGENDNITFVATITEPERSKQAWDGETGFIDKDMIGRYVDDLTVPIYYLCGPPGMVTAMRTLLNGAGVDDDDIRTEEFTGYSTAR